VKADSEPEITCSSNGQAKKQSGRNYLQEAECVFSVISHVSSTEHDREKQSGRPEEEAPGKREEPVATKGELFA
jgi:hypothetical protein